MTRPASACPDSSSSPARARHRCRGAAIVTLAGCIALAGCERQGELAVPQPGAPATGNGATTATTATTATAATAATADAPSAALRSATAGERRAAEAVLAAYLDASRDGSPDARAAPAAPGAPAARDTLLGCDAHDTFVLPITLLGSYRVLPASGAGDTLLGRAVVVTVAEQRADRRNPSRFLARQRVETDTLEWDLVRREDGAGWVVCNGMQFGFHEPEEATTWFPLGASRSTARRLADSLHARGASARR